MHKKVTPMDQSSQTCYVAHSFVHLVDFINKTIIIITFEELAGFYFEVKQELYKAFSL